MKLGLTMMLWIVALPCSGCGSGDSTRTESPGTAPFNAKQSSTATGTDATTDTGSSTDTTSATDTSTSTSTSTEVTGTEIDCDDATVAVSPVTNDIGFVADCQMMHFTSPGDFFTETLGRSKRGKQGVMTLHWNSADNKPPLQGKTYTEKDLNQSGTLPLAYGGYYETGDGDIKLTTTATFDTVPSTPGGNFSVRYEFTVQVPGGYDQDVLKFKGTMNGTIPVGP